MVVEFAVGAPLTYTTIQRTNLHPNPKFGVDMSYMAGSITSGGGFGVSRVSGAGGPIPEITTWGRIQTSGTTPTYMDWRNTPTSIRINPNATYNFSSYIRPTSASTMNSGQYVLWYAADGTTLLATSTNPSSIALPTIVWNRMEYQVSSPNPNAAYAVYVSRAVSTTTFASGDRLDVTGMLVEAV